jgi:hypothetical protein
MNNIVGFCTIDKNATSCAGAENPNEFIGKDCAVMEFTDYGDVLVLNPQGTALAMFEKKDVYRKFKCGYVNGIVTPPNLDLIGQMAYVGKATMRKGGYNTILKNMVIVASLSKGEFYDNFLWELQ